MEEKILLVEKRKGEVTSYYTSEHIGVKSVVNEIIYNNFENFFSGYDQLGPELLKEGDIEGFITHTSMCYDNKGIICDALNNLNSFIYDFIACDDINKLKLYISLLNERVLLVAGINVEFEIYTNYENEFKSLESKEKFNELLDNIMSCESVNDNTYLLWSASSNGKISMGSWVYTDCYNNMNLYIKHKIVPFMLDLCISKYDLNEDVNCYGVYELLNKLISISDKTEKIYFLNIKELIEKIDINIIFDKLCLIANEISKCFKKLNIIHELYLFKGTYYAKMLIKEHGCEIDENNLTETLENDILC